MKNKLLLFLLFTSFQARAATPTTIGVVPNNTITGNGSGLIPLECLSGTGICNIYSVYAGDINTALSAGHYYPFYKSGGLGNVVAGVGGPWQVGNGVTAYCFNKTVSASTTNVGFQLLASSNSFVFDGTPSGVIYYQAGVASKYHDITSVGPAAYITQPAPGVFKFSPNYWPGIQIANGVTATYHMDCYEK